MDGDGPNRDSTPSRAHTHRKGVCDQCDWRGPAGRLLPPTDYRARLGPCVLFVRMHASTSVKLSGAGYTHIVAPSFAAWACLGGFTGLALGKPMQQQMAPQCVYTRPLKCGSLSLFSALSDLHSIAGICTSRIRKSPRSLELSDEKSWAFLTLNSLIMSLILSLSSNVRSISNWFCLCHQMLSL